MGELVVKKSLYALADLSQAIHNGLIESGGEMTPEVEQMLQIKESELPVKIDAYNFTLERLALEEEFCREKASQWEKMARTIGNCHDRIKNNIKQAMLTMQTMELVGNESRFAVTEIKPKMVYDELMIPAEYQRTVSMTVVDKESLRADLDRGVEVPGAHLEPVYSIRSCAAVKAEPKAPKAKKSPKAKSLEAKV